MGWSSPGTGPPCHTLQGDVVRREPQREEAVVGVVDGDRARNGGHSIQLRLRIQEVAIPETSIEGNKKRGSAVGKDPGTRMNRRRGREAR